MKKHVVLSLKKKLKTNLSLPFLSPIIKSKNKKIVSDKTNILNYFINKEEEKIKQICDYDSPASFFSMEYIKAHKLEQAEKRKSILFQFISQSSPNQSQGLSKSQEKELTMNDKIKYERIQLKEINDLQVRINDLQEECNSKASQINEWAQEMDNSNLEFKAVQLVNDNMALYAGPGLTLTKKQKKTHLLRSLTNIEISMKTQKELIRQYTNEVKNIKSSLKKLKMHLKMKKKIMLDYYHNILLKGKDTRTEGLPWVIKAIWNLESDVQMKYLPTFLDEKAINYLFEYASKANQLKKVTREIAELKDCLSQQNKQKLFHTHLLKSTKQNNLITSFSDADKKKPIDFLNKKKQNDSHVDNFSFSLQLTSTKNQITFDDASLKCIAKINKLEQDKNDIVKEMVQLKENEMRRITKEYIDNDYEKRFNVLQDDVISALIGEENKDKEYYKQTIIRKEFLKKIKLCNFYKFEKDIRDD